MNITPTFIMADLLLMHLRNHNPHIISGQLDEYFSPIEPLS